MMKAETSVAELVIIALTIDASRPSYIIAFIVIWFKFSEKTVSW